jgi:hypothetical protein
MTSKLMFLFVLIVLSSTFSPATTRSTQSLILIKSTDPNYKEIMASKFRELEGTGFFRHRFGKRRVKPTRDEKLYAELINFMDNLDLKRY